MPGKGLFVGGVTLPLALAELGLIDEYEFVVHPRVAGHGPTLFAGLTKRVDLKLVSRLEFGSGRSERGEVIRRLAEPFSQIQDIKEICENLRNLWMKLRR